MKKTAPNGMLEVPIESSEWNNLSADEAKGGDYEVRSVAGEHLFIRWLDKEHKCGECIGNRDGNIRFYKIKGE